MMKLFVPNIEFLHLYEFIRRQSVNFYPSRFEADTKKNMCNNFTKSLQYDTLVTYKQVTKESYYNLHIYLSNFGETFAKI